MAITNATKTLKMGPTNCYLLDSLGGYLLIDTSLPTCFQQFLIELRKIRIDLSEIKHLLLTHSHDDHAGFAAELREKTSCRIIAHKNSIDSLKNGCIINVGRFLNRRVYIMMSLYSLVKRRDFEYTPVTLDDEDTIVSSDDKDVLRTIGVDGRLIHTPGHTDDSISVILANGDAFVGDACMNSLSFLSLHYRPLDVHDLDLVFDSWRKIIESGAKTIYPGHGKPFAVEELIHYEKIYASAS
jgi:glyoxylase-like metal-dependent hydrolase (beta-lactamase superfamily II)